MAVFQPKQFFKSNKVAIAIGVAVVALIIAVGLLLLSGRLSSSHGGVVMVVDYRGGLCAQGVECSRSHKLYEDGTFEGHYRVDGSEMDKLSQVLRDTDFSKYAAASDPMCPSFGDGQDISLQFPGRYSDKFFTLCMLDIKSNDSSINYIYDLIDSHKK